jgi:GTP-binding protein YchF
MGLICGLIGLPSSGKTVIFNAITAAGVSSYNGSEKNQAVVSIPDQRMNKLVEMYNPRKITAAMLEVVDIPGLKASPENNGRGVKLIGHIKDVDALLHVVRCFEDNNVPFEYETVNPVRDIEIVDLELMTADSITLGNKITRLTKKARSGDKDTLRELANCEKVLAGIQQGIPVRKQGLSPQEVASVRECNLVSSKPVVYIANVKTMNNGHNPHLDALVKYAQNEGAEVVPVCGKDEADISQLPQADRIEFLRDLGLEESSMERLLHAAYRTLGLISFFTTGEDEVRAWTCRQGDKAPVAAGKIHTDMEKGFIRMDVMRCDDLLQLGNESAVAKAGKQRVEGREYEVQDGDIVTVLFNR